LPDAVVVGCTMLAVYRMFIAVSRSSQFRMYAHVNVTDAPASIESNVNTKLMPSSRSYLFVSLYCVHAVLVHATFASSLRKP
jgi:hypothetical protein